jgi:hypothetical protein
MIGKRGRGRIPNGTASPAQRPVGRSRTLGPAWCPKTVAGGMLSFDTLRLRIRRGARSTRVPQRKGGEYLRKADTCWFGALAGDETGFPRLVVGKVVAMAVAMAMSCVGIGRFPAFQRWMTASLPHHRENR